MTHVDDVGIAAVFALWAALLVLAIKLGEWERTRELGRSIMAGLVGLAVTIARKEKR